MSVSEVTTRTVSKNEFFFPKISHTYLGVLISLKAISHVWEILYYKYYELKKVSQIKRAFEIGFNSALKGLEDDGYGADNRLHNKPYCVACGAPVNTNYRNDHIIPKTTLRAHGLREDSFSRVNFLPMCKKHNSFSKRTKDFWEWWFSEDPKPTHYKPVKKVWDLEPDAFVQIIRAYYKFYRALGILNEQAPKDWWGWKVLGQARGILRYYEKKTKKEYSKYYLEAATNFFNNFAPDNFI